MDLLSCSDFIQSVLCFGLKKIPFIKSFRKNNRNIYLYKFKTLLSGF